MVEYVYAALLLHEAGKEINEENLKKVVEAAGIEPDEGQIKALIKALEGVNIDEVLEGTAVAPVQAAAPQQAPEKEEKKEEAPKEEEKKEEEATAGLASLFG